MKKYTNSMILDLIANKAAANHTLKEQYEDTQYKRRIACR
jgi:hypothetical protein